MAGDGVGGVLCVCKKYRFPICSTPRVRLFLSCTEVLPPRRTDSGSLLLFIRVLWGGQPLESVLRVLDMVPVDAFFAREYRWM